MDDDGTLDVLPLRACVLPESSSTLDDENELVGGLGRVFPALERLSDEPCESESSDRYFFNLSSVLLLPDDVLLCAEAIRSPEDDEDRDDVDIRGEALE